MAAAGLTGRGSPSWACCRRVSGVFAFDPSRFMRVFAESGAGDFSPVAKRVRRRCGRVVYTVALRVVWAGLSVCTSIRNVRGIRRIRIGWPQHQHSTGRLTSILEAHREPLKPTESMTAALAGPTESRTALSGSRRALVGAAARDLQT